KVPGKAQPANKPAPTKPAASGGNAATHKPAPQATADYLIKSGDTLGKIAAQYHTTVNNLKSLNNLKSDFIRAGQKLKVPGKAQPANKPAPTKPATSNG
ncbi:LysM peptidoglycan-binding domain-containing protein, partial [Alkalihalophilus lindianensis]